MAMSDADETGIENAPLLRTAEHAVRPGFESGLISDGPKRRVSVLYLGGLIFFLVCGGPAGLEDAVRAAGPFPTLLAILLVPLVWAIPQALMTAELSTMNDSNGGYIIWVKRAFGEFGGWMNAYNAIASNMFNLSLYPILFVDFIERLFPLTFLQRWTLVCSVTFFVLLLNLRSMEAVGIASGIMTVLVVSPYVIELFFVLDKLKPAVWTVTVRERDRDLAMFLNTMLWNYSGWDGLGSIAGEVQNPQKTYPWGVVCGLTLITLVYLIPIAVGVSISGTNWSLWEEGYLIYLASTVNTTLGDYCLFTSAVSAVGAFNANMSTTSRVLWCVSDFHWAPKFLSRTLKDSDAPVAAVVIQSVTTVFLCMFRFEVIVQFANFLNCLRLFLEFSAFMWLKISEPDASRPFEVPGGIPGATIITIPKVCLVVATMAVASYTTWMLCVSYNIIVLILYIYWQRGSLMAISSHWGPEFFHSTDEFADPSAAYQPAAPGGKGPA